MMLSPIMCNIFEYWWDEKFTFPHHCEISDHIHYVHYFKNFLTLSVDVFSFMSAVTAAQVKH